MENENPKTIDYTVHQSIMARMDRVNKRWFIAWLITFIVLCCCVGGFIWYEAQFEDVTITAEQTADGASNNYAFGGDFIGSKTEGDNQAPNS